jgi:hypothetical protein
VYVYISKVISSLAWMKMVVIVHVGSNVVALVSVAVVYGLFGRVKI